MAVTKSSPTTAKIPGIFPTCTCYHYHSIPKMLVTNACCDPTYNVFDQHGCLADVFGGSLSSKVA